MKFKILSFILSIVTFCFLASVKANDIRSVIPVDDRTVEIQMEKDLSPEELDFRNLLNDKYKSPFEIDPEVEIIGVPMQVMDNMHEHVYRISVSLLSEYTLYRISYNGQRKHTFLTYDEKQTQERYKKRYGENF